MDTKRKCSESSSYSDSTSMKFVKSTDPEPITYCPDKCDKLVDTVFNQVGIRGQLIIYNPGTSENALTLLQNSLSSLALSANVERGLKGFDFCIGDEIICNSTQNFVSKQDAKHTMADEALNILKKDCFTLTRIRDHTDIKESDLMEMKSQPQSASNFNAPGSNAHNMMLKMGWTGGGLGLHEQGKVDNVQVYENIQRQGLGNKNIMKEVNKILKDFSNSNKFTILTFDSSFTKAEREVIHRSARRFNLKSKSEGKGEERRLTVTRKINRTDIVRDLLKAGCENSSYRLEIPQNFAHMLK